MNQTDHLSQLRHSAAHLLAAAVLELFPQAKPTIGPPIEDGFYYDFDFGEIKISDEDLPKIEQKMRELVKKWDSFERIEVNKNEALARYKDNEYKQELINEFAEEDKQLSIYKSGNFIDLCRGGHIEHPNKELKHFKLLSLAGAYWRGNEKNKMLTRIYGTAFESKEGLNEYLHLKEEAKRRDHRKLGQELDLFTISEEVGPGLIIWLPKGNIIKEELENWAKSVEQEWGYQRVSTPNITKESLYHTSGHLPYYKGDMFPPMVLDDGENYYLKPMNCPHHHMVYKARPRSYRELPLRLAEYGMCYRYEASGELFGLMRVRGLDINDAHIYCSIEQAAEEFATVMRLHEYYYKSLGIEKYHLEMALRDPNKKDKYHGDEKMWQLAEELMRKAVAQVDIEMVEEHGSAAFYGPKIDFIVHSSIGRQFAVSTNQIDLYMGGRFDLKYVSHDGSLQTPAIIHRAPLGSHERFIGFLIEHFGGNFPLWLTPVQVKMIPIADRHQKYAQKIGKELHDANIRFEIDDRSASMQKKIRDAQKEKVYYMLIVGDKEIEKGSVNVRIRDGKSKDVSVEQFVNEAKKRIQEKSID
ncbi:threonine--tRNA ligase [Candidatus Woesebacteria bacterium]|nr:threonine--tRNA ligase [Candidatus Woesebacteria bacterium]